MSRRFYLIVMLLVMAAAARQTTRGQEPAPAINVQDHRAQIRSALMHYTRPGTSSHDVLVFIKNRLLRPDAALPPVENHPAIGETAEQSNKRGVKSIRLALGQYLAHPEVVFLTAPLVMQREVIAQWAFDDHDRLLEIFVDKKSALY